MKRGHATDMTVTGTRFLSHVFLTLDYIEPFAILFHYSGSASAGASAAAKSGATSFSNDGSCRLARVICRGAKPFTVCSRIAKGHEKSLKKTVHVLFEIARDQNEGFSPRTRHARCGSCRIPIVGYRGIQHMVHDWHITYT